MISIGDADEVQAMSLAKEISEELNRKYPGHLWAVTVRSGVAVIKDLCVSSLYGYVLKLSDIQHDASHRSRAVMRAGGEILERARLERGARTEDKVVAVEGIKNYQPIGVH